MKTFKTGAVFASAAAMLAMSSLAVVVPAHAASAKVQPCYGVNSCKGQSDCKSGNHDCKGQNACKGQGFKALSAKACEKQGGSLTPPAN